MGRVARKYGILACGHAFRCGREGQDEGAVTGEPSPGSSNGQALAPISKSVLKWVSGSSVTQHEAWTMLAFNS